MKINPLWTPGILVKHHGLFAWGVDANEAVKNVEAIEYIAELANTTLDNNIKNPSSFIISIKRKIGSNSYYGQG